MDFKLTKLDKHTKNDENTHLLLDEKSKSESMMLQLQHPHLLLESFFSLGG